MLGFPIRTPSDLSSVDSSPRLIAASYVLHRLLVPRHPPYALTHLQQRCSRPLCSSQTTHPHRTNLGTMPTRKCGMPDIRQESSFNQRRNTRVFSQDPTVHRYNPRPHRHTGRQSTSKMSCQCSTHELPPDPRTGPAWSLRTSPPTCVGGTGTRCAP